ncbi:MAG: hypothetical protein KJZ69_00135 [Phycisphaerales bacterium]|nr:hypothetical protein [Phycisphaerales bacterium]
MISQLESDWNHLAIGVLCDDDAVTIEWHVPLAVRLVFAIVTTLASTVCAAMIGTGAFLAVQSVFSEENDSRVVGLLVAIVFLLVGVMLLRWGIRQIIGRAVVLRVIVNTPDEETVSVRFQTAGGITIWWCRLARPLILAATPVYLRGNWGTKFCLRGECRRNVDLINPIMLSGTRSGARRLVERVGVDLARRIGADFVLKDWQ